MGVVEIIMSKLDFDTHIVLNVCTGHGYTDFHQRNTSILWYSDEQVDTISPGQYSISPGQYSISPGQETKSPG